MKILLAAAALAFAAPAAAQSADPHAAHQSKEHGGKSEGHEGHDMDCCKDKNGNGKPDCSEGKMSCCAKHRESGNAGHAGH